MSMIALVIWMSACDGSIAGRVIVHENERGRR